MGVVSLAALGGCGAVGHEPAPRSLTTITSSDEVTTGTLEGQVVYVGGRRPAVGSPRPLAGGQLTDHRTRHVGSPQNQTALSAATSLR